MPRSAGALRDDVLVEVKRTYNFSGDKPISAVKITYMGWTANYQSNKFKRQVRVKKGTLDVDAFREKLIEVLAVATEREQHKRTTQAQRAEREAKAKVARDEFMDRLATAGLLSAWEAHQCTHDVSVSAVEPVSMQLHNLTEQQAREILCIIT